MHAMVFTYGTLLYPDVMEAVTGVRFASEAAVLPGYGRFQMRGRVYPGVVEAPGASTPGRLYRGVDAAAVELLDCFEGALYERRVLPVTRSDGTQASAHVYVVTETSRTLLTAHAWDQVGFEREHLAQYVAACRALHRENAAGTDDSDD